MSQNRPPTPPPPRSTRAARGNVTPPPRVTSDEQALALDSGDAERKVVKGSPDETRSVLNAPDLATLPEPPRPRFTAPTTLADLGLGDEDEDEDEEPEGTGPALVILDAAVMGKETSPIDGSISPAVFTRGKVVRASRIVGERVMGDEKLFRREMKRLLALRSVREATPEEARLTEVTFIEGEEELGNALEVAQQQASMKGAEVERLRRLVEDLGGDPNADPAETLNRLDTATGGATVMGRGRGVPGASRASTMNPGDEQPDDTKREPKGAGDRDPGFESQNRPIKDDVSGPDAAARMGQETGEPEEPDFGEEFEEGEGPSTTGV